MLTAAAAGRRRRSKAASCSLGGGRRRPRRGRVTLSWSGRACPLALRCHPRPWPVAAASATARRRMPRRLRSACCARCTRSCSRLSTWRQRPEAARRWTRSSSSRWSSGRSSSLRLRPLTAAWRCRMCSQSCGPLAAGRRRQKRHASAARAAVRPPPTPASRPRAAASAARKRRRLQRAAPRRAPALGQKCRGPSWRPMRLAMPCWDPHRPPVPWCLPLVLPAASQQSSPARRRRGCRRSGVRWALPAQLPQTAWQRRRSTPRAPSCRRRRPPWHASPAAASPSQP